MEEFKNNLLKKKELSRSRLNNMINKTQKRKKSSMEKIGEKSKHSSTITTRLFDINSTEGRNSIPV